MGPAHYTLLLLTLVAAPPAPQDDLLLTEGERVHGLCWFHAERAGQALSDELQAVVETAWLTAAPWLGVSEEPLEAPFLVNLYAKRRDFTNVVEGISPGSSKGRVAWGHWESRQVHVKLQPIFGEHEFEALGVPAVTLFRAARELVSLAPRERTGGAALAPPWLVDGLSAWAAQRALVAGGRAHAGLQDPRLSTVVAQVQELQRSGRLPTLSELVRGESGDLDRGERAALHEALVTFLLRDPEGHPELRARTRRWAAGEGLEEQASLAEDWEAEFPLWLAAQDPPWFEETPALTRHPEGMTQTPIRGDNAVCWSTALPTASGYTIRGEYLVFRNEQGMGQVNVVLAKRGDDYLMVSFNTAGGVFLWRQVATDDPPFTERASKTMDPRLPAREWVPFEIHVLDERILVSVRGEILTPIDSFGWEMGGQWGLGVLTGCVGLWRNVECVAIE